MPITFKKPTKKPSTTGAKKSKKTPVAKETKDKKALKSMEESLAKFHDQTDEQLKKFVEPLPEREGNLTHKLDEEQREARLVLMHRMLIRKVGGEEIRKLLNISPALYYRLKDQLDSRMRLDVSKVDVPYLIGDTLAFYDEVRSMALTMASSTSSGATVKVSAMQVALRAEQDKNQFLGQCGVYSPLVVEHIVRGMVSTGNFNTVDGQAERTIEAEEINTALANRLKEFAIARTGGVTDVEGV